MPKNKKLALTSRIQTYQILTNDDEVCISSLSSILIAVLKVEKNSQKKKIPELFFDFFSKLHSNKNMF